MDEISLHGLTLQLGHTFKDPAILSLALTHRSFQFENRASSQGNFERLEFLGDAVLDLVLAEELMRLYPDADEGKLTKWRASLVNESMLCVMAQSLGLGDHMKLGRSELMQKGKLRPRLLASVMEAILAALYLDGGLDVARQFICRQFG